MKLLVALRDSKTGSFGPPLMATTPGEAERMYRELLGHEGSIIAKYPHDFPMYEIGKYDDQTGDIYPLLNQSGVAAAPRLMLEASQLIQLSKEA